MTLNLKRRKFIDEYLKTGNGSQSAIDAGYSAKNSRSIASKLLKDPEIKAELKSRMEQVQNDNIMQISEILSRLSDIARGKATDTVVTPKGDVMEIPVSTKDKITAMKLLGKRTGAWIDRSEVTNNVVVNVDADEDDPE